MTEINPVKVNPDYYLDLVNGVPDKTDIGAYLTWVKLMSSVIRNLDYIIPQTTLLLTNHYQSIEKMFSNFCLNKQYQNKFIDNIPHCLNYLRFVISTSEVPRWIIDVARTELRLKKYKFKKLYKNHEPLIYKLVDSRFEETCEYIVVNHNVINTIQYIRGYLDMTTTRASSHLWYLQVSPIFLLLEPEYEPGLLVFHDNDDSSSIQFIKQ